MVRVDLPAEYSGRDLADAVEAAGRGIGSKVRVFPETNPVSGPVREEETAREVIISTYKPKPATFGERLRRRWNYFWTDSSSLISAFEVRTEFDQIYSSINVTVYGGSDCWYNMLGTHSAGFKEIKPQFEKFIDSLYTALKSKKPIQSD